MSEMETQTEEQYRLTFEDHMFFVRKRKFFSIPLFGMLERVGEQVHAGLLSLNDLQECQVGDFAGPTMPFILSELRVLPCRPFPVRSRRGSDIHLRDPE